MFTHSLAPSHLAGSMGLAPTSAKLQNTQGTTVLPTPIPIETNPALVTKILKPGWRILKCPIASLQQDVLF